MSRDCLILSLSNMRNSDLTYSLLHFNFIDFLNAKWLRYDYSNRRFSRNPNEYYLIVDSKISWLYKLKKNVYTINQDK
jgi:hypothetical protein